MMNFNQIADAILFATTRNARKTGMMNVRLNKTDKASVERVIKEFGDKIDSDVVGYKIESWAKGDEANTFYHKAVQYKAYGKMKVYAWSPNEDDKYLLRFDFEYRTDITADAEPLDEERRNRIEPAFYGYATEMLLAHFKDQISQIFLKP